ncbi:MAG: hypothetical protein FJ014_20110 [Chloroflexi bacterium]|nr:hypothetical protein [Chloroflexota bacterium]
MNNQQRYRIYTHITKSSFLHVEDALDIGKLRVFAGRYKRGNGAEQMTAHWLDLADARVLLADMSWGKALDHIEFKGSPGNPPTSRVLKVKSARDGKVWFRLETGPGEVIGEGAVKPAGEPTTVINVPFTLWESRRLALAVLSYCQSWETARMITPAPPAPRVNHLCPACHARPCLCGMLDESREAGDTSLPTDAGPPPDQMADQAPDWF